MYQKEHLMNLNFLLMNYFILTTFLTNINKALSKDITLSFLVIITNSGLSWFIIHNHLNILLFNYAPSDYFVV